MLSDAIRELRRHFADYDSSGLMMSAEAVEAHIQLFKFWEVEARNLEERLDQLGGHDPFLPRGGKVVPFPRGQR